MGDTGNTYWNWWVSQVRGVHAFQLVLFGGPVSVDATFRYLLRLLCVGPGGQLSLQVFSVDFGKVGFWMEAIAIEHSEPIRG